MSNSLQRNMSKSMQNGQDRFEFINNPNGGDDEQNGLNPKKLIKLIVRYKWLIILFLVSGSAAGWFYAETLPPAYKSSGRLLISSLDVSASDGLSDMIAKTTGYDAGTTLQNELQILQSRSFSLLVARNIMAETAEKRNRFPILWSNNEETGQPYRANEETVASRIRKNISFRQPEEESDVIEVSFTSELPSEAAKVVNAMLKTYVDYSTRQNRLAAASTAEFLEKERQQIKQKLDEAERRLRDFMSSSDIVQINAQITDLVDQRAEVEAQRQSVNLELQTTQQAIINVEEQLERIRPKLSDRFSAVIGPRIRASQEELVRYEIERMQIIAKNPELKELEEPPVRLQFLNEQIANLQQKIRDLSDQLFTDENTFVGLNDFDHAEKVTAIQSRLTELKIDENQLQARLAALNQLREEMDIAFNSLPRDMIQLAKLQRDVRLNEELYLNISRQYANMSVWKQSQFGFGRIIDLGVVPEVPVSPNKLLFLIIGLMLGGFCSAGLIATKEFMDNTVKDVEEIRTRLVPSVSLSAIPAFEKLDKEEKRSFNVGKGPIPDETVMLLNPSGIASESFRRLKNNIVFQSVEGPPKILAVTSPGKGDGKSTVVANLGIAFAEENYKTLVMGADFRRPKLQNYFGISEDGDGLSDYMERRLSFNDVLMRIQDTELKSLKVLASGNSVNRPEGFGNSGAFQRFLVKMRGVFDIIIIDTAPFGVISDSTSILKNADATLVVVRHRKTNRNMLLRTLEELGQIKAKVMGIVLNDFDHKKEAYSSDYYHALYESYEAYVK